MLQVPYLSSNFFLARAILSDAKINHFVYQHRPCCLEHCQCVSYPEIWTCSMLYALVGVGSLLIEILQLGLSLSVFVLDLAVVVGAVPGNSGREVYVGSM